MIDVESVARHYGGKVCKGNALIATPGHSIRDRGTAIKASPAAPDGVLVACYNGTRADALEVKAMLRRDGFLPLGGDSKARRLTATERKEIRQAELARQRERAASEERAATAAADLWATACPTNPDHSYLERKALVPFGIRQSGKALLVPMFDAGFRLWNVQRIQLGGFKLFLSGGRTKGLFWLHAAHLIDGMPSAGPLVIGEGYASMAAIHMATGLGVVAAMSASNLKAVAQTIRNLFPMRAMIVAADDDRHLAENIGLNAAQVAARAIGARLATPLPVGDEPRTKHSGIDFADIPRADIAARIVAARLAK